MFVLGGIFRDTIDKFLKNNIEKRVDITNKHDIILIYLRHLYHETTSQQKLFELFRVVIVRAPAARISIITYLHNDIYYLHLIYMISYIETYTCFFIRNLTTHMSLKVAQILPIFWPKRFLSSFLFLLKIRNSRLKWAKSSQIRSKMHKITLKKFLKYLNEA